VENQVLETTSVRAESAPYSPRACARITSPGRHWPKPPKSWLPVYVQGDNPGRSR
jgi:hypothetical protein